ncbi:caspase family protein [Dactylosporangium sp. CA-139066]|uniref:caspase family protein n=1 Tax=Dactylosporangium sp. CA-139066 TaxID=3239930 RepID=UPI003D8CA893
MPDHALVVGCDAYPNAPGADLRGAVADAVAVRDWLTGPGGVPAEHVTCLLSPSAAGLQPGDGVATGPATFAEFGYAIDRLLQLRAGPSDRLFVYFAGHGMRTDPVNPVVAHDALLLRDFDRRLPQLGCVGVQDLVSRLEQTGFGAVVVILDACRDFPFRWSVTLGGIGFNGPATSGPPARIFLLQATLPGRTAHAGDVGGVIRGDFTVAVLDALAGAGAAKRFDDTAARPYIVDWTGLTAYVEAAVPEQGPRPRGDGNLVLATFPDGAFDPVKLTVEVGPDAVRADPALRVRVSYDDPGRAEDVPLIGNGPAPVHLDVPPRRHRVVARLGEQWNRRAVDVYTDTTVTLSVDGPGPSTQRTYTPEVSRREVTGPEGLVTLVASDPLAPIELRTLSGRVVASGVGELPAEVPAGQYTAAALDHAAREHLEAVEVLPFVATDMAMRLPDPAYVAVEHARRHAGTDPRRAVVCIAGGSDPDLVLDAPPPWLTVPLAGHPVTVPLAPGVIAVLSLLDAPVSVTLYDIAALDDERALLALDRAQRLYAAGRRTPAARVFARAGVVAQPAPVFRAFGEALGGAAGEALGHGLAARVDPADRGFLLPAAPWAVFLDRPERGGG